MKKKAEDLPEIPDYERPELEKFEKPTFTQTTKEKPDKVILKKHISVNYYCISQKQSKHCIDYN